MKMLKKLLLQQRIFLLLLMLVGNSNSVFSANSDILIPEDLENHEQQLIRSELGEQVNDLFDPILPVQKSLVFFNTDPGIVCDFDSHILGHTISSLNYLKRSRYLLPALGVREVIFPFHVFL